jgi:hypothetical protein
MNPGKLRYRRSIGSCIRGSEIQAGLFRVEPGFVDEDPLPVFDLAGLSLKRLPLLLNRFAFLFLGVDRLFFSRSSIFRRSTTHSEGWETRNWLCSRSFSCNSARVRSEGHSADEDSR